MSVFPETPDRSVTRVEVCPDTGIVYNLIERVDLDYKGFAGFFFHFRQKGPVRPDDFSELIITHESFEMAIEYFGAKFLKFDAYANSVFDVEIIGIDLNPYRADPVVMVK